MTPERDCDSDRGRGSGTERWGGALRRVLVVST